MEGIQAGNTSLRVIGSYVVVNLANQLAGYREYVMIVWPFDFDLRGCVVLSVSRSDPAMLEAG